MQESEKNPYEGKIISPTYGIELTQQEVDIIQDTQKNSIKFFAIPLALMYGGGFYLLTRRIAPQLGMMRGLTAIVFGSCGWAGGIYIGGKQLDARLLRDCPDGNAAKLILAKKGQGEYPIIAGTNTPADPEAIGRRLRGLPDSPQNEHSMSPEDNAASRSRKMKTNKYGDVMEEG